MIVKVYKNNNNTFLEIIDKLLRQCNIVNVPIDIKISSNTALHPYNKRYEPIVGESIEIITNPIDLVR